MSELLMQDDAPQVRAADAMQAAYFHRVLAAERVEIGTELAQSRRWLEANLEAGDRFEIRQVERHLCEQESRLRHVDWMISCLERRFSGLAGLRSELS